RTRAAASGRPSPLPIARGIRRALVDRQQYLDVFGRLAMLHEEERLQHEDREKRRASAREQACEYVVGASVRDVRKKAPRGPAEPSGEREVSDDEERDAGHREPCMTFVVRARRGEIRRDVLRPQGIYGAHSNPPVAGMLYGACN